MLPTTTPMLPTTTPMLPTTTPMLPTTTPLLATDAPTGARPRRLALRWLATALAFPPSGLLATTVVGPVDRPIAALVGGALVGLGVGAAQALARRDTIGRHGASRWIAATTVGAAVGLMMGAAVVGYRTGAGELALMGAMTGGAIGVAQAAALVALRAASLRRAVTWAVAVAPIWALGWTVTAAAGIDVERQYAVFGASGAIVASGLLGLLSGHVFTPPAGR